MVLLFFEKFDLAAHPDPGRANKAELLNAKEEGAVRQRAAPTSFWANAPVNGESRGAGIKNWRPCGSVHRPDSVVARQRM